MQRVQLVICVDGLRGGKIYDKTVGWGTTKIQYCSLGNYGSLLGLHHPVGSSQRLLSRKALKAICTGCSASSLGGSKEEIEAAYKKSVAVQKAYDALMK